MSKVLMYQALYFPDLAKETEDLRQGSLLFERGLVELARESAIAKAEGRSVDVSAIELPFGPFVMAMNSFHQRAVAIYGERLGLR
jgi:hypothetical protein